jgi:hypothetical protein
VSDGHGSRSGTKTTKATKITNTTLIVIFVLFVNFVPEREAVGPSQCPSPGSVIHRAEKNNAAIAR